MGGITKDHAIVVGGSFAGLATAAVLARRFTRVTVLERHAAPHGCTSIVPHGRYPHVLLEGGAHALERILPGFGAALVAAGAPQSDRDHVRWWSDGWRVRRATDTGPRALATRALIESTVRERVHALPNVDVQYGVAPSGLILRDGRVAGVHTQSRSIAADLVVDCSGRGSRASEWLSALGRQAPPVTEIEIDLGYLVIALERGPSDASGMLALVSQNIAPTITRLGIAIAVENDRWMVLLGGYFGDIAPADRDGYLAFARSLPVPDIAALLETGRQVGAPLPYRFHSNRRVHIEKRADVPHGFVVLGDAMCSFNPLYGQGMSVAAIQAERLGQVLDAGRFRSVHRELAGIADRAWMIAAGGDLAYPQVAGARSAMSRVMRRYMARVFRACSVDPHVVDALSDVTNLLAPPTLLLRPTTVARVLRGARRASVSGRSAGVPVASGAPAAD